MKLFSQPALDVFKLLRSSDPTERAIGEKAADVDLGPWGGNQDGYITRKEITYFLDDKMEAKVSDLLDASDLRVSLLSSFRRIAPVKISDIQDDDARASAHRMDQCIGGNTDGKLQYREVMYAGTTGAKARLAHLIAAKQDA